MTSDQKALLIRLSTELHKELGHFAVDQMLSKNEIVTEAIKQYISSPKPERE